MVRCEARGGAVEPYAAGEQVLLVNASVGVALAPSDGVEPSTLLQLADAALYRAKREGRNTFRFAGLGVDADPRARPGSPTPTVRRERDFG